MMMPSTMGASAALLLSLCIQGSVSFQSPHHSSSLATSSRITRPLHRTFASSSDGDSSDAVVAKEDGGPGPDILQPYLPAMDPNYSSTGPVGNGKFVISRSGPPLPAELTNEQMLKIVKSESTDLEVNTLVWKCLGYRYNENDDDDDGSKWTPAEVFPKWKERFPDPPDFIGMQRVYSREVDTPSLRSNQALVRSIPMENKQMLKAALKPIGWKGFQFKELTPNKTRRAQCANWLIFFREELFGFTVEELRERRRVRKEKEAEAAAELEKEGKEAEWKPPVKEVF